MTKTRYKQETRLDFHSIISGQNVSLPYSEDYRNPGYIPGCSGIVHGYDIGGTLAAAEQRDRVIKELLDLDPDVDLKQLLFDDPRLTKNISQAQEEGIRSGKIKIQALDGVVEQLEKEQARGEDRILLTVGTYQMAKSFIYGAGLHDYVSALVTSEEARTGRQKTPQMFIAAYERLRKRGKRLVDYCDDSKSDAQAASQASRYLQDRYGSGFSVYLVDPGRTTKQDSKDYTVISSLAEKQVRRKRR